MTGPLIMAIDPGPRTSGYVLYSVDRREVVAAVKDADIDQVRRCMFHFHRPWANGNQPFTVVCERTQAGPPSTQVVLTTEVVGRIVEMAHSIDAPCHLYYRRQVLQALNCARKGNKDSLVRVACIELHGGDRKTAIGTKKQEGPLYGVTSHAWQALGLACAHIIISAQEE